MPLGATFEPEYQARGLTSKRFIAGLDAGASLMDRAQARRLKEEQADQQRAEFQAKLPVLAAAAQADLASANASVQNAARMEEFRTKAATESKDLNDAYLKAIELPSFEEQARALSAMQPRVAYMDVLPEYKGFVTAVNNATVKAHASALADRGLANKLDQIDLRSQHDAEMQKQKNEMTVTAQKERETMTKEAQVQREAHAKEIAELRTTSAEKIAGGRSETQRQRPAEQAAVKSNEALLAAGQDAMPAIRDAQRGIALLDEVRTGSVAQLEQSARRVGQLFGADLSTAKPEELQRILGDAVLKRVNQTKGAISDKEMILFDRFSASMGKSAEGNKAILAAYSKALRRSVEIAKMVNKLRGEGVSEREIQLEVNDVVLNQPITDADFGTAPGAAEPLKVLGFEKAP